MNIHTSSSNESSINREGSSNHQLVNVNIRMYRPGLGDCFLLTFERSDGQRHHVLIDCGVLQGTRGGADRIRKIAADILNYTDRHIHTLVVTHEHWDHISGFYHASNIFGFSTNGGKSSQFESEQVWLPWTEDPQDEQVRRIENKKLSLSLAISAARMGMDEHHAGLIDKLSLFNADSNSSGHDDLFAATRSGSRLKQIMDYLRNQGNVSYLQPDDVVRLDDYGVKFYVLGPSRNMPMLGGMGQHAWWEIHPKNLNRFTTFFASTVHNVDLMNSDIMSHTFDQRTIEMLKNNGLPFMGSLGVPIEMVERGDYAPSENWSDLQRFFRRYFGSTQKFIEDDVDIPPSEEWRRIDHDWLNFGETLALQHVSLVNNTSLVLAIELVDSGKVLLFPGDAEEANWETWENKNTDLDRLLSNTVVYKVGHHGSCNATNLRILREMMSHRDLVALVPVDKNRAAANGWMFPDPDLYDLLEKRTQGRIILNCDVPCDSGSPVFDENRFPRENINIDPSPDNLWVDYRINLQ